VTDMVADEQRLPAGAHPPAAGGGVAVPAHNCTRHLAVDGADKGPGTVNRGETAEPSSTSRPARHKIFDANPLPRPP
jgi:hypothetical protein